MNNPVASTLLAVALLHVPTAYADSFGSGANSFDIEFVRIGEPGNPDDPQPWVGGAAGKVNYEYRIGKYEISEDMINKANALGGLGITQNSTGPNKPSTMVSWFEAAIFVNWLNVSKGYSPAYKFVGGAFDVWQPGEAGYNSGNRFRNSQAVYVLPTDDEWYKAAHYDPNSGVYFEYPTGSDRRPRPVASGTEASTAVWFQPFDQGPADVTLAGGLSPYGTMGQGGNVWEWEETEHVRPDTAETMRWLRGGCWDDINAVALSYFPGFDYPTSQYSFVGFRVASVPEPGTRLLAALAGAGIVMRRRR